MPATWTDDRVDLLCRLWRDGKSASDVARALGAGVTRNAVIGKVHRLGLGGRARPSTPGVRRARPVAPGPKRRRVLRAAPARVRVEAAPPPPESGLATVESIRRGQCRWPIGEPGHPDFSLCGRPVVRGAYCAGHAVLAYRPLNTRRPRDHLLRLAGLA